jgi:hypothetical protein
MRKHIMGKFFSISNTSSEAISNDFDNFSSVENYSVTNSVENYSVTNSVENKSIKDIYNASKLYHRYLSTLKIKITERNYIYNTNSDNFNESYENAESIYDEIKKQWILLSNGPTLKYFTYNYSPDFMDIHKENYYKNFQMLEAIAKIYGFDEWLTKKKKHISSIII